MTQKELEQIAETVAMSMRKAQPITSERTENGKISDMIFKGFSTISLALVTWILSTVSDMKQQQVGSEVKQETLIESVREVKNEVKQFTSQPRFTEAEFSSKIIPLTNQVNLNTAELNKRTVFMTETDNEIQKMKLDISLLRQSKP